MLSDKGLAYQNLQILLSDYYIIFEKLGLNRDKNEIKFIILTTILILNK